MVAKASSLARDVFLQAVEQHSPEQWSSFLDTACGFDDELRAEVERLLDAHGTLGSFMAQPVTQPVNSVNSVDEPLENEIGRYKLLEKLGEGGMGVVYLAEQTEPVRRRVALKLIKPGMDSRQIVGRFEAERQALAMMDHPHIARVLDGGSTELGRPYFVMELVQGPPITDFCDAAQLTIRARLELFIQICRAVQHAHQKGIIHRDLKPSNVLVALQDDAPVPKVIDFGVAKAINQPLTDETIFTQSAQVLGTPLYMSPEQAAGGNADVDTRSDVYSLGVLLYELLTGTTPFDGDTLRRRGFDELRRMIREDEPAQPSRRLSTLAAEASSTISERRSIDARRLGRTLRGELDWIVMKTLEKDRARRYQSVADLAEDVQRYLDHRPVEASPPSTWYRCRKFVRRHRARVAIVSAASALLTLAVVATFVLYWQASETQRLLTEQVGRSLAATRAAIDAGDLSLAGQHLAEAQGGLRGQRPPIATEVDGMAREIATRRSDQEEFGHFMTAAFEAEDKLTWRANEFGDEAAKRALDIYLQEPEWLQRLNAGYLTKDQKRQVQDRVFDTLVLLADFELREKKNAAQSLATLQRAHSFHLPTRASWFVRCEVAKKLGDHTTEQEAFKEYEGADAKVAWDWYLPGRAAQDRGEGEVAIRCFHAALRLERDHYSSLWFLAKQLKSMKRFDEAIALLSACIAFRPTVSDALSVRAALYLNAGHHDWAAQDWDAAAQVDQLNVGKLDAEWGPTHKLSISAMEMSLINRPRKTWPESFLILEQLRARRAISTPDFLSAARRRIESGDPAEVVACEECYKYWSIVYGAESHKTLQVQGLLGGAYLRNERFLEALAALEPPFKRLKGDSYRNQYALACRYAGQFDQALAVFDKNWHQNNPRHLDNHAATYVDAGKIDEAIAKFRQALAASTSVNGPEHPETAIILAHFAGALFQQGATDEAEQLLRQCLAIHDKMPPNDEDRIFSVSTLGNVLERVERYDEAAARYEHALPFARSLYGAQHEEVADLLTRHGYALVQQDKAAEGEALLRESLPMYDTCRPNPWFRFAVMSKLGEALYQQQKYEEAESLLLNGYQGLLQHEAQILFGARFSTISHSIMRVVEFYEATNQSQKAEPLLRECVAIHDRCLAIYDKSRPSDWRRYRAMSLLGGLLCDQHKYEEAEPLLVDGFAGMEERKAAISPGSLKYLAESAQRLASFYEATSQPEKAVLWRDKAAELQPAE